MKVKELKKGKLYWVDFREEYASPKGLLCRYVGTWEERMAPIRHGFDIANPPANDPWAAETEWLLGSEIPRMVRPARLSKLMKFKYGV